MKRLIAGLAALALLLVPTSAYADGGLGGGGPTPPHNGDGGGVPVSSGPKQEQVRDCVVYASGTGMGSYCATGVVSGGDRSLKKRFGGQPFYPCKYETPPPWMELPENPDPDKGRFMVKRCIEDVNWSTWGGGTKMHATVSLEWVPYTAENPPPNDLMDFLWAQVAADDAALPVPMMRPEPSRIPVVGYPTFFTFAWMDAAKEGNGAASIVAEGPYADKPFGGPFRQVVVHRSDGDLTMRAQATEIIIDPHQVDMAPIRCTPDNMAYVEGGSVADQTSDCRMTFTRSSATAAAYADGTAPTLPSVFVSSYPLTVTVKWRVTYALGNESMQELGDGFEMTLTQALPVQEVQAPNEPPIALF